MLGNELAWLIRGCRGTSAGVWPVMLTSQHGTTIRGQLWSDRSYRDVLHHAAHYIKRIGEIPHTVFLTFFVVCFQEPAYAALSQNFDCDVSRYFSVHVYVFVCCGSVLWCCVFHLCWMTIWCGNCMEPQIITAVEPVRGKTHFSLFSLSALCCLLFAPFCFSPVVFTLLLCVSLRSLCS